MRTTVVLTIILALAGGVAVQAGAPPFVQNFEADAVGSAAGWNGGQRWFDPTPGGVVAVTSADSVSPSNSLSATDPNGTGFFVWRSYEGLSSDGVQDISVSFDMKVSNYAKNIAVSPFAYNTAVWGGDTGSSGAFGWPVNTNLTPDGSFIYVDETSPTPLVMLDSTVVGDLHGQWLRWSGTVHPVTRKADVTITVLTGPSAGASGGVVNKDFQYGVASDYYGGAMDALRGLVIFNEKTAFGGELLVDNLKVVVPEPTALLLAGFAGIFVLLRRR